MITTSKATTNIPALTGILTTSVSIFLLVLQLDFGILLATTFLLRADKSELFEVEVTFGPMTEDIGGAF